MMNYGQNIQKDITRNTFSLILRSNTHKLKTLIKIAFLFLLPTCILLSCNNKHHPDTSKIKLNLQVIRFEKDFFGIDTNNINQEMEELRNKYHDFSNDFVWRILGLEGVDTSLWSSAIKLFHRDYYPIYTATQSLNKEVETSIEDTKEALKLVNYYFPQYKLPEQFITFIGPIDAYATNQTGGSGDIITTHALGAGLQLHLGANAPIYNTEQGMQLYPSYISKRFTTAYISVNAMKNIIDDVLPPIKQGSTLLDIFIDHGKRMYLLDLFLPEMNDTLKLGYTLAQLKGAEDNEGLIWNYFLENNLLYETDPFKIRSYTNDAPSTVELGQGSPGFISLFVGRQIIRKYMEKFPRTDVKTLLELDSKRILSTAGYKPR